MIKEIWTLRSLRHQVFRQILERWEDEIAQELKLELKDKGAWERRANSRLGAILRKVDGSGRLVSDQCHITRKTEPKGLMFAIFAPLYANSYVVQSNVVPVIIDCWGDNLNKAALALTKAKVVVVTNLELVKEFEKRCPRLTVLCVPLAVESSAVGRRFDKKYDLIQVGRRNEKLHSWALELTKSRPKLDYWYADTSGVWPRWFSTQRGEISVGLDREDYLATLGAARVALVSAPGIDGGESRTGGYNPVTPRFYEAAALGCRMVGRYPQSGMDYVANNIGSVCSHVESYASFVSAVEAGIAAGPDESQITRDFVQEHTGTAMARRLREKLTSLGYSFPSGL